MAANMWCGKVKRPCRKVGIASPVRQSDGDGVGCKVSAFRSHCSTEILCTCSMGTCSSGDRFEETVMFGCRGGQVGRYSQAREDVVCVART
jgi:hypothetical protein